MFTVLPQICSQAQLAKVSGMLTNEFKLLLSLLLSNLLLLENCHISLTKDFSFTFLFSFLHGMAKKKIEYLEWLMQNSGELDADVANRYILCLAQNY